MPDRAAGARTRQPENSKRAHLSDPALQTPPKFHEKTPREGRKERILWRERGKKARNFGPPTLRAPHPSGPPTLRGPPPFGAPHPSGPPTLRGLRGLREPDPSGPPPFGGPTLRAPTGFGPLACKKKQLKITKKKQLKKIQTVRNHKKNNFKKNPNN